MKNRINKFLSAAGVCSRRKADELIEGGRIKINDRYAKIGDVVEDGDMVYLDEKEVKLIEDEIIIAFNKPIGIVCTAAKEENNIIDYINFDRRIYPIGRLDKMSEGLIFLTNNGEIMNRLILAKYRHEKEYVVEVNKNIDEEFIKKMSRGIYLKELNKKTAACKVIPIYDKNNKNTRRFKIILVQGLNRQIRRMCEACGYEVKKLKRVRIMNVKLGDLKSGEYRYLTNKEYKTLIKNLGLQNGR